MNDETAKTETAAKREAVEEQVPACPQCNSAENKPYLTEGGVAMRACHRCLIQWRDIPAAGFDAGLASTPVSEDVCECGHPMDKHYRATMGGTLLGSGDGICGEPNCFCADFTARPTPDKALSDAVCIWSEDDPEGAPQYSSDCGATFDFVEDGVTENGFKFCYRCGKPIEVKVFTPPGQEDE